MRFAVPAAILAGFSSTLLATPAIACKCTAAYPVCNEVQHSDRVFIGTVMEVTPALLDPWNRIGPVGLDLPAAEIAVLQEDPSPAALARLRAIYLNLLRDTGSEARKRLAAATTHAQLDRAFEAVTARGRLTRFHVDKAWKAEAGDDEDKEFIEVWSDAGDCGVPFQKGETWLVYADEDEETSTLETSVCTRTRRLTEAGSDLAYLFHYESTPATSSRLEGLVSSNVADQFIGWSPEPLSSPVAGATVRMSLDDRSLYATTAGDGRFVFDGLGAGDYELTLFASGFPEVYRVASGPLAFRLEGKSCGREILIAPR